MSKVTKYIQTAYPFIPAIVTSQHSSAIRKNAASVQKMIHINAIIFSYTVVFLLVCCFICDKMLSEFCCMVIAPADC